ncbi:MAG: hypothetical protein KKH94_11510 [Candidatus Omnitrophica bacterium]|nr:hypothetical protein [Candidatus Omnitrophota bacterium]
MSERIYKHSLTPGLVEALTKFGEVVALRHENKVHLLRDLRSKEEDNFSLRTNAQKLRYFGLIAHYKNALGFYEKGYWLLTKNGAKFLKNKLPIHRTVSTLNNEVIARDIAQVFISDVWEEYRLHKEKFQGLWLGESTTEAMAGEQKNFNFAGVV